MPETEKTEKILVRGVNWLGDAVMSTPALQRLRQARPAAQITLLTPDKLAALWQDQPFIDRTITLTPAETLWQVARRLRREKFSEAVAFPNSIRSALELWLAGIPRRIGLARPGRCIFLSRALPPRPEARPMRKRSAAEIRRLIAGGEPADRSDQTDLSDLSDPSHLPPAHHARDYLYLTAALGASPEPLPPRIFLERGAAAEICRKLGLDPAPGSPPWFGLNPGAEYGPAKRWPAARFAAAAFLLQKETRCRWLIFGGSADQPMAEQIASEIRNSGAPAGEVLNLAGKTNLRELAAALKLCRLLLTNDTGPMHLAAAVGTPVVVPFGSTSPELTGPGWSPAAQIVRKPVPCSPCFRRDCPIDLRCLTGIETAQIVEAARRALASSQGPENLLK